MPMTIDLAAAQLWMVDHSMTQTGFSVPHGLTLLPFFEGERTTDLPQARGLLHMASLSNVNRPNFTRQSSNGPSLARPSRHDRLAKVVDQRVSALQPDR
jgi:hypothetical protein